MADGNKKSTGMEEQNDQSQGQGGTGNFSNDQTGSATGQKGGQASSQQSEDTTSESELSEDTGI